MKLTDRRLFELREEGRRLLSFESMIQRGFLFFNLAVLAALLYLMLPLPGPGWSKNVLQYTALAAISVCLMVNYIQQFLLMSLRRKWTELESQSIHDGLTQIYNRSYFEGIMTDEMNRAKRYGLALSLCIADIDNFKYYNDTQGHAKGDFLLQNFASRIQTAIRSSDAVGRYGGDEFCILLPHTDLVSAEKFLSRILPEIQEWLDCSFSAGVTAYRSGEDKASFLARADLALYQAKREGKNRIRCMIGEDGSQAVLQF